MVPLIIVLVVVVALALVLVSMYNGLIKTRNVVQEAWAQVDVELKRRHDLIGNLVETVKGYATHEHGTLDDVTRARSQAMAAAQPPRQVAAAEAQLTKALVQLIAVSEAYPDLKANQSFMSLQSELASTEDRIASARRYYNATVRELNTKVESIPTSFLAGPAGVSKAEYFEAEGLERAAPQVSFGSSPTAVGAPPTATPVAPAPQDAPYPRRPRRRRRPDRRRPAGTGRPGGTRATGSGRRTDGAAAAHGLHPPAPALARHPLPAAAGRRPGRGRGGVVERRGRPGRRHRRGDRHLLGVERRRPGRRGPRPRRRSPAPRCMPRACAPGCCSWRRCCRSRAS